MSDQRRISSRRSDSQLLEQLLQLMNRDIAASESQPEPATNDRVKTDYDIDDEFDYQLAPVPDSRDGVKTNELILAKEELALGQLIEGASDQRVGIVVDVDPLSVNPGDPHPVRILRMSDDMEFELVPWDSLLMDSLVDERLRPLRVEIGGWLSSNRLERAEAALLNTLTDYEEPRNIDVLRQTREEADEQQVRKKLREKYKAVRQKATETTDERRQRLSSALIKSVEAEKENHRKMLDEEIQRRQEQIRKLLEREKTIKTFDESVRRDVETQTQAHADAQHDLNSEILSGVKAIRADNDAQFPLRVEETLFQRGGTKIPYPDEVQIELEALFNDVNQFNADLRALSDERQKLDQALKESLPEIIQAQHTGKRLRGEIEGFIEADESDQKA